MDVPLPFPDMRRCAMPAFICRGRPPAIPSIRATQFVLRISSEEEALPPVLSAPFEWPPPDTGLHIARIQYILQDLTGIFRLGPRSPEPDNAPHTSRIPGTGTHLLFEPQSKTSIAKAESLGCTSLIPRNNPSNSYRWPLQGARHSHLHETSGVQPPFSAIAG